MEGHLEHGNAALLAQLGGQEALAPSAPHAGGDDVSSNTGAAGSSASHAQLQQAPLQPGPTPEDDLMRCSQTAAAEVVVQAAAQMPLAAQALAAASTPPEPRIPSWPRDTAMDAAEPGPSQKRGGSRECGPVQGEEEVAMEHGQELASVPKGEAAQQWGPVHALAAAAAGGAPAALPAEEHGGGGSDGDEEDVGEGRGRQEALRRLGFALDDSGGDSDGGGDGDNSGSEEPPGDEVEEVPEAMAGEFWRMLREWPGPQAPPGGRPLPLPPPELAPEDAEAGWVAMEADDDDEEEADDEDNDDDDDDEGEEEEAFDARVEGPGAPADAGLQRRAAAGDVVAGGRGYVEVAGGGDGDEGEKEDSLVEWSDEDVDGLLDLTAEEVLATGRDLQGIPWERLQFSREHYRATRLRQYRNYVNVLPDDPEEYRPQILAKCQQPRPAPAPLYAFAHNNRSVSTTIVHFQLRNLVWATSRNDVFIVCQNSVNHWSPATCKSTEVINLSGGGSPLTRVPEVGRVQVSTLCVQDDLIATGGFAGEVVVKRLGQAGWVYAGRVSSSDNGITNGLEIYECASHGPCIIAANNDALVRVYETSQTFKNLATWQFPWAVNFATMQPHGQLAAVVGDDPETHLMDPRARQTVQRLSAHADYSFAAAWHPGGWLLATGNQDTTTVVWDIRQGSHPLARMAGRMGAIRALRWSPDGKVLAACEPADFVHLYDASYGFEQAQEIDLFGEISGMSFTPAGDMLFVGIADVTYASLLGFARARHGLGLLQQVPQGVFVRAARAGGGGGCIAASGGAPEDHPWVVGAPA